MIGDVVPPDQVLGRSFRTALSPEMLSSIQTGVLKSSYRDRGFFKCPFDVALYQKLIGQLRPASIIEVGTMFGGSALWFADHMELNGIEPRVVSVDLHPPQDLADSRICLLQGNSCDLAAVLTEDVLAALPHPWLVSEDSAHTFESCSSVLRFFDNWLRLGDYIVIEDGVVSYLPEPFYLQYAHGPNRAVERFLLERGADYEVDASLCDLFGYNVTWNPNGWLRRKL